MIGVISDPSARDVVREFFELFKTPWEFYQAERQYDVVLSCGDHEINTAAPLAIIYCDKRTKLDDQQGRERSMPCVVSFKERKIPLYGASIAFTEKLEAFLPDVDQGGCLAFLQESDGRRQVRIGYDLFEEVRTLLTVGQPIANAMSPTLELHIDLLRTLITSAGIELVEIPPIPKGFRFIVCLTHDVDHPSIRGHKWDHTVLGFLYRATVGSVGRFLRGRMTPHDLMSNWLAALKLPLVQLGLAKDFWREFGKRYLELEEGRPSTFFVIPFKDRPGKKGNARAPAFRASRYGAEDIANELRELQSQGCEIGLHGLDAWGDSEQGREELRAIQALTGNSEIGVRMHWLYYEQETPCRLEQVGASYDSTIGYNDTVGYRAGTTQAYKSLGAEHLLELPMHAMDTALFYPAYLALSPLQARELLNEMATNATTFGGVLTINWHDRSVSPERLWTECYRGLLKDLEERGAWFATAQQVISWFRKRRALTFNSRNGVTENDSPALLVASSASVLRGEVPGFLVRTHKTGKSIPVGRGSSTEGIDQTPGSFADNTILHGAN